MNPTENSKNINFIIEYTNDKLSLKVCFKTKFFFLFFGGEGYEWVKTILQRGVGEELRALGRTMKSSILSLVRIS